MAQHHYATRSKSPRSNDTDSTAPQLLRATSPIKGEALCGSSVASQKAFLRAIGIISAVDLEPLPDILSEKEISILSCALDHHLVKEEGLTDPYFTDKEWGKVQVQRKIMLHDAHSVMEDTVEGVPEHHESAKEWLQKASDARPLCGCVAHLDEELYDITYALIEISRPLTDDSGNRLAATLLPLILKAANSNLKFETAKQGTTAAVKYILQLPSGDSSIFSGWPDFQVLQTYSFVERRLGRKVLREERVRGIGEVQSPPGTSAKAKTATLAQAGVYSIGQFAKTPGDPEKRKVTTIILYKDMSSNVALATLDPEKATSNESVGEVTYKLVDSVHGYYLNQPDELKRFSSVFIATLRSTLTQ